MKRNEEKKINVEVQKLYAQIVAQVNQGEIVIPNDSKDAFLSFNELSEKEQVKLIEDLLKSENLPEIMRNFFDLTQLINLSPLVDSESPPPEIHQIVATFLDNVTLSSLALTSSKINTLFKTDRKFTKFLQLVAYGEQDKVEGLFTLLTKQKRDKEIQEMLCKADAVTDYSGRTFRCTAYEYAYWAKDTHMCRMLERNMNENTKALMLKRCKTLEKDGLKYTQNGKEYCTKHFDLTPLKTALKDYVDGYNHWLDKDRWDAIYAAWMKVGLAQRDVPAHVIHEYCRSDRSFSPIPKFNERTLPRTSTFYRYTSDLNLKEKLFPLIVDDSSGLGVTFALARGWTISRAQTSPLVNYKEVREIVNRDLLAIHYFDEVRTTDCEQSRDNLKPKEPEHRLRL